MTLHIVADRHIWHVEEAFSCFPNHKVKLEILEAHEIQATRLRHADVLLVRSSTRVNEQLLGNSSVRFVATATVGDDHIDGHYLKQRGIAFASAAGSSTGSVIEYMMTVLLQLQAMKYVSLPHHTLGIIGAGRIGSRLLNVCQSLGMDVIANDPPRAAREQTACLLPLDTVLQRADILSLHTPLVLGGKTPTYHLIDADVLANFRGVGIINAARGTCINNDALLNWLNQNKQHWAVLDCWEHEPTPNYALLQHPRLVIATPHIAGHSLDGKAANTQYIHNALCHFLHCTPTWAMHDALPTPRSPLVLKSFVNPWDSLCYIAQHDYPLMRDHQSMRMWKKDELEKSFRHYRRYYPIRRAWSACSWVINQQKVQPMAKILGYL